MRRFQRLQLRRTLPSVLVSFLFPRLETYASLSRDGPLSSSWAQPSSLFSRRRKLSSPRFVFLPLPTATLEQRLPPAPLRPPPAPSRHRQDCFPFQISTVPPQDCHPPSSSRSSSPHIFDPQSLTHPTPLRRLGEVQQNENFFPNRTSLPKSKRTNTSLIPSLEHFPSCLGERALPHSLIPFNPGGSPFGGFFPASRLSQISKSAVLVHLMDSRSTFCAAPLQRRYITYSSLPFPANPRLFAGLLEGSIFGVYDVTLSPYWSQSHFSQCPPYKSVAFDHVSGSQRVYPPSFS